MEIDYKPLLNKITKKVWLSPESYEISFQLHDDTFVTLHTFADCCSQTWIADIIGFDALKGKILKVSEIPTSEPETVDGRSRDISDLIFGLKFHTTKGICDIIFRNSSNGFYSGNIDRISDVKPAADWKEITDDYCGT